MIFKIFKFFSPATSVSLSIRGIRTEPMFGAEKKIIQKTFGHMKKKNHGFKPKKFKKLEIGDFCVFLMT